MHSIIVITKKICNPAGKNCSGQARKNNTVTQAMHAVTLTQAGKRNQRRGLRHTVVERNLQLRRRCFDIKEITY